MTRCTNKLTFMDGDGNTVVTHQTITVNLTVIILTYIYTILVCT